MFILLMFVRWFEGKGGSNDSLLNEICCIYTHMHILSAGLHRVHRNVSGFWRMTSNVMTSNVMTLSNTAIRSV